MWLSPGVLSQFPLFPFESQVAAKDYRAPESRSHDRITQNWRRVEKPKVTIASLGPGIVLTKVNGESQTCPCPLAAPTRESLIDTFKSPMEGEVLVVPLYFSQKQWGGEHLQVFVVKIGMTERKVTDASTEHF